MSDFFNPGWGWFITIVSLAGIIGYGLVAFKNFGKGDFSKDTKTTGHVWDGDLEELDTPIPNWWLGMLGLSVVFGLCYWLLYPGLGSFKGLLGWSQYSQYDQEMQAAQEKYGPLFNQFAGEDLLELSQDPDALRTGKRLFQTNCAVCHGSDARGAKNFPNLRDHDWLYGGDPQTIEASVLNGRKGVMPAWGQVLGNDLDDVVRYVMSLSRADGADLTNEIGKQRFETTCAACHGADGTGNQQLGAPNLTDDIWLYGHSYDDIADVVRNGRTGIMPAHEKILGQDKVHILAAYVYSLSQEKPQQ